MARRKRIQSVFLNIPYDNQFEELYLAYIVGLTQLGFHINATLAVPNQGRLDRIVQLIEESDVSIHDLSRIELSSPGIPRFNMPLELGLALYRSHATNGRHRVFVFEKKAYRMLQSTSDVNVALIPKVHNGRPKGVMVGLRNIFHQPERTTTVPDNARQLPCRPSKLPQLHGETRAALISCLRHRYSRISSSQLSSKEKESSKREASPLVASSFAPSKWLGNGAEIGATRPKSTGNFMSRAWLQPGRKGSPLFLKTNQRGEAAIKFLGDKPT